MMSSTFIAHVGQRVPGVFVANCGGDDVCAGGGINVGGCWSWDPRMDLATRDKISILYNYGSDDFLAGPSHTGYLKFQSLGFSVQEQIHQGATHCNHPIAGPTISFWEQQTP